MNRFKTSYHLILLILALTLSACFPSKPAREDIIGLWTELHAPDNDLSTCGSIEFFSNGAFEAKNIPSKYFVPAGYDSPEQIDAHGTWELDTSSNDPYAVHRIELLFSPLNGLPSRFERVLYIATGGDLLYAGVDNSVSFKKGEKCE